MRTTSRMLTAVVLSTSLAWGVTACSDDGGTNPGGGGGGSGSAVVGNWNATSFIAQGVDLISLGMGMTFSFNSSGGYSFSITNDQGGLCDTGPNCSESGSYTANANAITLDPGTTDVAVLNYTINGNVMSVTATIEGVPISVTLDRL